MTWSIVALASDGSLGVAVASRFFAVGALCAHGAGGVAALATQALVNPLYARAGLAAVASRTEPTRVVTDLVGADAGRDHRQLHIIDARGRTAAHTGSACIAWCGHRTGPGYSVAGNMLAGAQVLEATAATFEERKDLPFAARLIEALAAGEAAGGDKRGKQAAALRVYSSEEYPALDLRVDDHPDPMTELRRLHAKSLERFVPFVQCLPTSARPAGITDRADIERHIERYSQHH